MTPPHPWTPARPTRRPPRGTLRLAGLIRSRPRFRPRLEAVEDRNLLSGFLVDTIADSGPGSLRQAIVDANATPGPSTIVFAIPGAGVHRIAPAGPLPAMTHAMLIDGTSQPGYAGTPLIELTGQTAGLTITGSEVSVQGLVAGVFVLDTDRLP